MSEWNERAWRQACKEADERYTREKDPKILAGRTSCLLLIALVFFYTLLRFLPHVVAGAITVGLGAAMTYSDENTKLRAHSRFRTERYDYLKNLPEFN